MTRRLLTLGAALVLPLTVLLCVQWPLRDWVQAYSRQANDVAQILFGLYTALAVTAASVAKTHLALVKPAQAATKNIANWRAWCTLLCVGPWALFLLWTAAPQALASVRGLEIFSEGLTPGYFLLRVALVLLAVLVLAQALWAVLRKEPPPP